MEMAKFEVCNQRGKVIGETQIPLFCLATGPSHNDFALKGKDMQRTRLFFDLKFSQHLELSIQVKSLKVLPEDPLQFSYYNFCLKMPSMHYNIQTCLSYDQANPTLEANGFFQGNKRSDSRKNSICSKAALDDSILIPADSSTDEIVSKNKKLPIESPCMRSISDIEKNKKPEARNPEDKAKKEQIEEMSEKSPQEPEKKIEDSIPFLNLSQMNSSSLSMELIPNSRDQRKDSGRTRERKKFGYDVFVPTPRRNTMKMLERASDEKRSMEIIHWRQSLDQILSKGLVWTKEEADQLGKRFPCLKVRPSA